jgi:cell division protein FtsI (penicillin-binding protein 3)
MNNAVRSAAQRKNQVIHRESSGKRLIDQSRIRLFFITAFFVLSFGAISFQLIEITVFHRNVETAAKPAAAAQGEENYAGDKLSSPTFDRNDIVDRNGLVLATTLATQSLFANPHNISNPEDTALRIVKTFPDLNEKDILKKLKHDASFVWIKRNLTPKEQGAANNLGIPGLYFQPEQKRVYPYRHLLSHVVGFVGIDDAGLSGAEKYFDRQLRDVRDHRDPLRLSIDLRLQNIVAEEVKQGMDRFSAIGATGIVLDLHSGEILAMTSLPDFDPNHLKNTPDEALFNRASLGSYEMGSTFKTFTTAMALDYGIVNLNDGYDASHPIEYANYTIHDEHPKNRWLSIPEIYTYSSNIGTVRMIMDVGRERQQTFLRKLGLMDPIKIELPEVGLPHYPSDWTQLNSMTISYGHGMSVTPLHLVRAFASIVNGGTLEPITLLKGGNDDKLQQPRIISEKTSRQMRRLMRMVVEYGTAKQADVPGYRVGGKTGTAEKISARGGYSKKANLALFISTFPVDDPKYVVLVMVDEPKGNKSTNGFTTAGWIAAPIVCNIISRMAPMFGIRPVFDVPEDSVNKYWVNKANQRFLHAVSY